MVGKQLLERFGSSSTGFTLSPQFFTEALRLAIDGEIGIHHRCHVTT